MFGGNQGLEGANYQGWTVGINLGTEHLFGDFFGFRWFFGVNYGDLFIPSYFNSRTIAFRLGIDAIINFVSTGYVSFGMIIGLETGLTSLTTLVAGQVPVAGRIGLTTGLGEHNRIDLIVGIPFYTLNTNTLVNDPDLLLKNVYNPLQFTLGYKFLF